MDGKKGVLEGYKQFSQILQKSKDVTIDNIVFKLHYRWTFFILVGSSVLVSLQQYFGDHIDCVADSGVSKNVINTYCFIRTTFTVVRHFNEEALQNEEIPHPGVGTNVAEDEVIYHAYYQWVAFVLFLQGVMFYIPHYIWKQMEGDRLRSLVVGLKYASLQSDKDIKTKTCVVPSKLTRQKNLRLAQEAFIQRLHINRPWALSLVFCEILNALNLCFQIFILDVFLGGEFMSLGTTMAAGDYSKQADPLEYIFPKVTKCTFHKYGPSGSIQKHDALCVMSLNVINEKIFTVLWFWLLILVIATALSLLWRFVAFWLHAKSERFNAIVFRATCPESLDPWDLVKVTDECHFSDWLFLHYLAKNLDDNVFRELFLGLAARISENEKPDGFRFHNDEMQALNGDSNIESCTSSLKMAKKSFDLPVRHQLPYIAKAEYDEKLITADCPEQPSQFV